MLQRGGLCEAPRIEGKTLFFTCLEGGSPGSCGDVRLARAAFSIECIERIAAAFCRSDTPLAARRILRFLALFDVDPAPKWRLGEMWYEELVAIEPTGHALLCAARRFVRSTQNIGARLLDSSARALAAHSQSAALLAACHISIE